MKYKILIDLDSIKENERAGETSTTILNSVEYGFESNFLPKDFIDGENIVIETWSLMNGEKKYSGKIIHPSLIEKYLPNIKSYPGLVITQDNNVQTFYHNPIKKYSFSYLPMQCNSCKKGNLEPDVIDDSGLNILKCDNCNKIVHESNFDYETIEEVLEKF